MERSDSRAEAVEAGSQALAPMGKDRRLRLLASQHRVRRAWGERSEVGGRDSTHSAVQPGLLEDRLGEVGPRAVALRRHVVDAEGQLDDPSRGLGEMAG